MGLIFIPSTPIPSTEAALADAYWYAVWDRPITVPHDLRPGGTVYLADPASGTIVWETLVTDTIAVPYESSDMLRTFLTRRWALPASIVNGDDPYPGFCIAWRATAVEQVNLVVPDDLDPLAMWTSTRHLDDEERNRRGLRDEGPCPTC